jgi:hypothetical protein
MRTAVRLVILAVAASGVIATCVLAILYEQHGAPASEAPAAYTIGVWEGQLAVFEGEDTYPARLFDVPVSALPEEEQKRLQAGLSVSSELQLQQYLEDYTS